MGIKVGGDALHSDCVIFLALLEVDGALFCFEARVLGIDCG